MIDVRRVMDNADVLSLTFTAGVFAVLVGFWIWAQRNDRK